MAWDLEVQKIPQHVVAGTKKGGPESVLSVQNHLNSVLVMAGLIPLDLMVEERVATHGGADEDRKALRGDTIRKWQVRWDNTRGVAE